MDSLDALLYGMVIMSVIGIIILSGQYQNLQKENQELKNNLSDEQYKYFEYISSEELLIQCTAEKQEIVENFTKYFYDTVNNSIIDIMQDYQKNNLTINNSIIVKLNCSRGCCE